MGDRDTPTEASPPWRGLFFGLFCGWSACTTDLSRIIERECFDPKLADAALDPRCFALEGGPSIAEQNQFAAKVTSRHLTFSRRLAELNEDGHSDPPFDKPFTANQHRTKAMGAVSQERLRPIAFGQPKWSLETAEGPDAESIRAHNRSSLRTDVAGCG